MNTDRRQPSLPLRGLALTGLVSLPCLAFAGILPGGEASNHATSAVDDTAGADALSQLSHQFRAVARAVEPSVVHVEVLGSQQALQGGSQDPGDLLQRFFMDPHGRLQRIPQPGQGEQQNPWGAYDVPQQTGTGSGWVYDKEGHIVTNHHVVDGAQGIRVRFFDGTERTARVVASDARTDVAVLAVDDVQGLMPARLSDEAPQQGDIVFAFGSPMSFDFSMSQGIVAGTGRRTGILGPGGYEDFIQTDAAINPGNSGGPLCDVHGRVVGMNASIASRSGLFSGIGFAIPVPTMRPVIDQLISDGRVHRGFLGVYIQDDPALLRSFGFEGRGVLVSDVQEDGPAAKADLRRGDIVTAVDGEQVETSEALRFKVATVAPGSSVKLDVVRKGEQRHVEVRVAQAPEDDASASAGAARPGAASGGEEALLELGFMQLDDLDAAHASELGLEGKSGVLIESVRPGSAAAEAGLRPGMALTEVDDARVATTRELIDRLGGADLANGVRITVVEGGRQRYAFLRIPR